MTDGSQLTDDWTQDNGGNVLFLKSEKGQISGTVLRNALILLTRYIKYITFFTYNILYRGVLDLLTLSQNLDTRLFPTTLGNNGFINCTLMLNLKIGLNWMFVIVLNKLCPKVAENSIFYCALHTE